MIAASVFAGVALTRFRRSPTAIMMGALSVALAARGLGAHRRDDTRAALAGPRGSHLREAVTINQGPSVVYAYWRDLTNLSRFMAHVDRVDVLSDTTSRWVVRGPLGPVEWNAEIINDIPGELIAWRTQRGAGVASAGSVRFKDAPGGRGTEVTVTLQYSPPGGRLGAWLTARLGHDPAALVRDDLRRLKQVVEASRSASGPGERNLPFE